VDADAPVLIKGTHEGASKKRIKNIGFEGVPLKIAEQRGLKKARLIETDVKRLKKKTQTEFMKNGPATLIHKDGSFSMEGVPLILQPSERLP
jgi:hypothetical protein